MWVLGGEVAEWHKAGGEAKGWPDHSAQGRPGCGLQASHFLCLNEGSWKCLPVTASSPDAALGWSQTKSPSQPTGIRPHRRLNPWAL